MTAIPIQLKDSELKKIDYLIKIGRYKNRNQAIKSIFQERLEQETILLKFDDLNHDEERKKLVQELSKDPNFSFIIKTKKSAVNIVSEERERYQPKL